MLIEKFEEQVNRYPHRAAVRAEQGFITYGELNRSANRVARLIEMKCPGKGQGERVGLLFAHGVEMIIAILGTLKAGCAYVPLSTDYPAERISYMLADSGASLILTGNAKRETAEAMTREQHIPYVILNREDRDIPGDNAPRKVRKKELAYIMYTSGSTGKPKGVMQNHENVMYFRDHWCDVFSVSNDDRMTLFSSFCHDASIPDIFSALLSGAVLYPFDMKSRQENVELSQFLIRERITLWHSVPSLYTYFAHTLSGKEVFKDIRFIILGGEPVRKHEVELLKEFFPHSTLADIYGQTESTVNSIRLISPQEEYERMALGEVLDRTEVFVIDDEGNPVEPLEVGEILVACPHVSPGYWNNEDAAADAFADDDTYGRLYWTGDLGCLLPGGVIELLGRKDFQVKIRGFRVEPGEIESRLLQHSYVKEVVVNLCEDNTGERFLCAYFVPSPPGAAAFESFEAVVELKTFLARFLPDYMIPSHVVSLEKMPLTPNGKVDRKALPEPGDLTGKQGYTAPRDAVEIKLVEIWSGVLGIDRGEIGIDHNFFHLGGHSLKAALMTVNIQKVLHVEVPLRQIFQTPDVRGLAGFVKRASRCTYYAVNSVEKKEYYVLSSAQERLYVLQQIVPDSTAYNLPNAITLTGEIDLQRFRDTFEKLVARHDSLRTSFPVVDGEPVQRIHTPEDVDFEIEYYEAGSRDQGSGISVGARRAVPGIINSFIRPFDLSRAPLLRVGLIPLEKKEHILIVDMHHIVSDGTSLGILSREFMALYAGRDLPPLRLRYKDYSLWQKSEEQGESLARQEDYWLDCMSGEIPVLNLPLDYPRPPVQSFAGNRLAFVIGEKETAALKSLLLDEEITLFMLLLAIFNVFLSKLSGQEDIIVGTPTAGRRHADLQHNIGMFVNTLSLRNFIHPGQTFKGFLQEIKDRTLTAYENQAYSFEDLVNRVEVERDPGRNPLFDVMFTLQNMDLDVKEIPGLKLKPYKYESHMSKFDLSLTGVESGGKLSFVVEYCSKLFKEETIAGFIAFFKNLVASVTAAPGQKIAGLSILPEEEKQRLLFELNDTHTDVPEDKTIHGVFEDQAEKTPDNVAVIGQAEGCESAAASRGVFMTYRSLSHMSGRLASLLIEKKGSRNRIAAIVVERCVEMMIGIIGILKAGRAYLPIEPEYPAARKQYMIKDSNTGILLTTHSLYNRTLAQENLEVETVFIETGKRQDAIGNKEGQETAHLHLPPVPAAVPAYVIYTSGSTGKPKGVVIEHSSVLNLAFSQKSEFNIDERERVLQFSSFCFDASIEQMFIALFSGSVVVLVDKDTLLHGDRFAEFITKQAITHIHAVPSFLNNIDLEYDHGIKRIIAGGDVCSVHLAQRLGGYCDFYNEYGPTETTVTSIEAKLEEVDESLSRLPIGKPIGNTQLYVLDKNMGPVPRGIIGELYIGGKGVARGYLNNPELTAERFINWSSGDYRSGKTHLSYSAGPPQGLPLQLTNFQLPTYQLIYRTGDLVRWLPDGNMDFLGRIDDQVKIRGFRIELGEIENRLLKHDAVKEAVVIVKEESSSEKYLCAYIVGENSDIEVFASPGFPGLRAFLSHTLPDYMVPAYFVLLEEMPLTPNGKVDRQALPEPGKRTGEQGYRAPRDAVELKLVEIWSGVLGIDRQEIGIDHNFFHLGGHSLKAAMMTVNIQKVLNVKVPLQQVFQTPDIRGLAGFVKNASRCTYYAVNSVEKKEYYMLSSAQERLYVLQQIVPDSTAYNLANTITLTGEIDRQRFGDTFEKLIVRHESLRTSFHYDANEPVQKIHDPEDVEFEVEYYEAGSRDQGSGISVGARRAVPDDIIDSFRRPFDLSAAPLLRAGLISLENDKHILMVDMHHIISDGTSLGILSSEFMSLYAGRALPSLRLQYKDYSLWQKSEEQGESLGRQEDYWLDCMSGDIPVLNLPLDYPRPPVQSFAGSTVSFELRAEERAALNRIALDQEATLFMVLLGVFNVLLSRLGGQEDIIVGTPTAGRSHADIGSIIGMFVNTLGIRSFPVGDKSFGDFLQEVKKTALNAFENQQYQFEDLIEKVEVNRDVSRNPLFDVMFTLQNMENPEIEIPSGLKLAPYKHETGVAKFDLSLYGMEFGEKLGFALEYCTKLFKEETIIKFVTYFKTLIGEVIADPGKRMSELRMVPEEEMRQLLFAFNDTEAPYEYDKTIPWLFEEQVEKTPHRVALIGAPHSLTGQEGKTSSLRPVYITYEELSRQVDGLARVLVRKGTGPGTIGALMVERSLEMIVGIFALLKAGGAYLPIDPHYPRSRREYVIMDSSAGLLLTARAFEKEASTLKVERIFIETGIREGETGNSEKQESRPVGDAYMRPETDSRDLIHQIPRTVETQHLASQESELNVVARRAVPTCPAYVIYTSGSTGLPKGVMIEHHSVVNRLAWMQKSYPLSSGDIILQKTTYTFDVSVWELFWWSFFGAGLYLLVPGGEKDPAAIIAAVVRYNVGTMHFVPSMLDAFLYYLELQKTPVRLPALRQVFASGEALKPGQVERFNRLLYDAAGQSETALINLYGPTEATVDVSYFNCYGSETFDRIPIGKPIDNIRLYILDRDLNVQPLGAAGQLYIAGVGLARGYINRPELTAEKFIFNKRFSGDPRGLFFKKAPLAAGGKKLYQTGDLARWLPGGVIEYLGRIDNQVKIRGFRIELGEIENRLVKHDSVKEAVVIAKEETSGENYLCAYIAAQGIDPVSTGLSTGLREFLSRELPDYMIPSYFVYLDELPLTPNGKIDRKLLPEAQIEAAAGKYAPPENETEEKLQKIWSRVLELDGSDSQLGIDDHFFEMGGHSLKATRMISEINREFGIGIGLDEVFFNPTIRTLARRIKSQDKKECIEIMPVEEKEYYPLSFSQKRMFVAHQVEKGSVAYNMPVVMQLSGNIDREQIKDIFIAAIERHESFRTSFTVVGSEPVQKVHKDVSFDIKTGGLPASFFESPSDRIREFIRPFDLASPPLLRVELLRNGLENSYILMVDMHHIISDGYSLKLLVSEFTALYKGMPLPRLKTRYKDAAVWQGQAFRSGRMKQQEDYWLNMFAGDLPGLELPADYPRPPVRSIRAGDQIRFSFDRKTSEAISAAALKTDTTLFILLLAAYNVLLFAYTGREDIIVGSPVAGRHYEGLLEVIGVFLNMLPMRNRPQPQKTFKDFLKEVKGNALQAFENQDYPFEELIKRLGIQGEGSRNPLFDVEFAMDNSHKFEIVSSELGVKGYPNENQFAKFDLYLLGIERPGSITLILRYYTALFSNATAGKIMEHYVEIVKQVVENPEMMLKDVSVSLDFLTVKSKYEEEQQGDFRF